jgi:hypothetical protein
MSQTLPGIDVMFVAGFGPISRDTASSTAFYIQTLGLPLKPMEGNADYLLTEEGQLTGREAFCRLAAVTGGNVLFWRRTVARGASDTAGMD